MTTISLGLQGEPSQLTVQCVSLSSPLPASASPFVAASVRIPLTPRASHTTHIASRPSKPSKDVNFPPRQQGIAWKATQAI
ncbi:hypothetical protein E2C01_056538 [Portunus trituberculatus]|uniref:Uncharacterized protein n=1 Tax=Portunus trituberculatus TaxID=210409 RepID=A0A5B7GXQ8_PORTR|nr:hypothetical protein [Portunus trituberculatus]